MRRFAAIALAVGLLAGGCSPATPAGHTTRAPATASAETTHSATTTASATPAGAATPVAILPQSFAGTPCPARAESVTAPAPATATAAVQAGGTLRTYVLPGVPLQINALHFADAQHGWLGGDGTIERTADGGHTWHVTWCGLAQIRRLDFVDATHGWALGYGLVRGDDALLRTTDGGRHWTALGQPSPRLGRIRFVSPTLGYGVARQGGALLRTTDGGRAWKAVTAPAPVSVVCFAGAASGWIAATGNSGTRVWRTADGGRNWHLSFTVAGRALDANLACAAKGGAWLLVNGGAGMSQDSFTLFHAANGTRWLAVAALGTAGAGPAPGKPPHAAKAPEMEPPHVLLVPSGTAYLWGICAFCDHGGPQLEMAAATGGGFTKLPPPKPAPRDVPAVSFISTQRGWLAERGSFFGAPRILATDDGGRAWSTVFRAPAAGPTSGISFPTAKVGFGLGTTTDPAAVLKTTDGGVTWRQVGHIPAPARRGFGEAGIAFTSPSDGWAVSGDGRLWRSTDDGRSWRPVSTVGGHLTAIAFTDATHGCVVKGGPGAEALGTSDGGKSWKAVPTQRVMADNQALPCAAQMADPAWQKGLAAVRHLMPCGIATLGGVLGARGWAFSDGCKVRGQHLFTTADAGRTWTRYDGPPDALAFGNMAFPNAEDGWMWSGPDHLLRTTDGGAAWQQVPSRVVGK